MLTLHLRNLDKRQQRFVPDSRCGARVVNHALPVEQHRQTIIDAPRSTKNKDMARDPEMHQAKRGNQWYFGMKAHIGVDSRSKLIRSVAAAANVHDSQMLEDLLNDDETRVWAIRPMPGKAMRFEHPTN